MAVYFIRGGDLVKIGKANHPEMRLRELQTGSPFALELLLTLEGGTQEERALHKRFIAYRVRNEWFRYEDEIRDFIATSLADPLPPIAERVRMSQQFDRGVEYALGEVWFLRTGRTRHDVAELIWEWLPKMEFHNIVDAILIADATHAGARMDDIRYARFKADVEQALVHESENVARVSDLASLEYIKESVRYLDGRSDS
jgi:hypothetical protein